jgi:hypothetical protein
MALAASDRPLWTAFPCPHIASSAPIAPSPASNHWPICGVCIKQVSVIKWNNFLFDVVPKPARWDSWSVPFARFFGERDGLIVQVRKNRVRRELFVDVKDVDGSVLLHRVAPVVESSEFLHCATTATLSLPCFCYGGSLGSLSVPATGRRYVDFAERHLACCGVLPLDGVSSFVEGCAIDKLLFKSYIEKIHPGSHCICYVYCPAGTDPDLFLERFCSQITGIRKDLIVLVVALSKFRHSIFDDFCIVSPPPLPGFSFADRDSLDHLRFRTFLERAGCPSLEAKFVDFRPAASSKSAAPGSRASLATESSPLIGQLFLDD